MLRQISEAVRINGTARESLINNKSEWNYVGLPRVLIESEWCSDLETRIRYGTSIERIELGKKTVV